MNFIKHLRGFFELLELDDRMTAHHISLYMALFNLWNMNRFREQFEVNRLDLMGMARIGSRNTYSRCMKQVHDWAISDIIRVQTDIRLVRLAVPDLIP